MHALSIAALHAWMISLRFRVLRLNLHAGLAALHVAFKMETMRSNSHTRSADALTPYKPLNLKAMALNAHTDLQEATRQNRGLGWLCRRTLHLNPNPRGVCAAEHANFHVELENDSRVDVIMFSCVYISFSLL